MDVFQTAVSLNAGADYEVKVEGMDLRYNPKKRDYSGSSLCHQHSNQGRYSRFHLF